jgi:hypothetical protein
MQSRKAGSREMTAEEQAIQTNFIWESVEVVGLEGDWDQAISGIQDMFLYDGNPLQFEILRTGLLQFRFSNAKASGL